MSTARIRSKPAPLELGDEMAADEASGSGDDDELARIQFHSSPLESSV